MVEMVNFLLMVKELFINRNYTVCITFCVFYFIILFSILMQSAGSRKNWIANDVDLEALEPEELDVLVIIFTV